MCPDDRIEIGLDGEAQRQRATCIEAARPARHDAPDEFVRLATDAGDDLIAGDPAERFDLFADGTAHTRHGEVDPVPELVAREACRMDQKADRRARTRVPEI